MQFWPSYNSSTILTICMQKSSCIHLGYVLPIHDLGSPTISYEKSEYDQEIPQSQTADKPMAPLGRATQQLQNNQLSLPHQDDCKTRMDIK